MELPAVYLVQLPSPPNKNVFREWAGGFGTALPTQRSYPGHDQKYYDIPYSTFLYIAHCFEKDLISYRYLDLQAQERFDEVNYLAVLQEEKPRILITNLNLPSLEEDLALLKVSKKTVPELKIILIGPVAKLFKNRILSEDIAALVMEESEELLTPMNAREILNNSSPDAFQGCSVLEAGAVVKIPARQVMKDLNFVDFPAYHLLNFHHYESSLYFEKQQRYMSVFTSKGCPYQCSYCPYPYGFGDQLIYRDPVMVGADIERLVKEYGVEHILFRDQVFTMNKKHAKAVCEEVIKRNMNIPWVCETRYDLVDPEMLKIMYAAGCREIHYGLESADKELFAKIAKPDGVKSLDLFQKVIGWTKQQGIRCHVHLIVGLPGESWRTIRNTAKWLRKTRPDSVQLAYFTPYPETPVYAQLLQAGELNVEGINWGDCGSFTQPLLPTRFLSLDEIRRARDHLQVAWRYTITDRILNKIRKFHSKIIH